MKASAIHRFGSVDELRYEDVPDPAAGAGQVLIQVKAAGINPADYKHRSGMFKDFVSYSFPYIGGYDVAGVVVAVGEGVSDFAPGARVHAMLDPMKAGGYAELAVVDASYCALIPDTMSFEQAAVIPCSGLTGFQIVDDALRPHPGQRVLVTGGTGMVGRFAVYAASQADAHVIAAVKAAYADEARALGASETCVLDGSSWSGEPFDAAIDTVGGAISTPVIAGTKAGGPILLCSTDPLDFSRLTSSPQYIAVVPDGARLAKAAAAVAQGEVPLPVVATYPLSRAGEAQALVEAGGVRGKVVLTVE